jgi:hypothetical protein
LPPRLPSHLTAFFSAVQPRTLRAIVKNRRARFRAAATIGKLRAVFLIARSSPFFPNAVSSPSLTRRVSFSAFSSKLKRKEKSRLFYFAASSL